MDRHYIQSPNPLGPVQVYYERDFLSHQEKASFEHDSLIRRAASEVRHEHNSPTRLRRPLSTSMKQKVFTSTTSRSRVIETDLAVQELPFIRATLTGSLRTIANTDSAVMEELHDRFTRRSHSAGAQPEAVIEQQRDLLDAPLKVDLSLYNDTKATSVLSESIAFIVSAQQEKHSVSDEPSVALFGQSQTAQPITTDADGGSEIAQEGVQGLTVSRVDRDTVGPNDSLHLPVMSLQFQSPSNSDPLLDDDQLMASHLLGRPMAETDSYCGAHASASTFLEGSTSQSGAQRLTRVPSAEKRAGGMTSRLSPKTDWSNSQSFKASGSKLVEKHILMSGRRDGQESAVASFQKALEQNRPVQKKASYNIVKQPLDARKFFGTSGSGGLGLDAATLITIKATVSANGENDWTAQEPGDLTEGRGSCVRIKDPEPCQSKAGTVVDAAISEPDTPKNRIRTLVDRAPTTTPLISTLQDSFTQVPETSTSLGESALARLQRESATCNSAASPAELPEQANFRTLTEASVFSDNETTPMDIPEGSMVPSYEPRMVLEVVDANFPLLASGSEGIIDISTEVNGLKQPTRSSPRMQIKIPEDTGPITGSTWREVAAVRATTPLSSERAGRKKAQFSSRSWVAGASNTSLEGNVATAPDKSLVETEFAQIAQMTQRSMQGIVVATPPEPMGPEHGNARPVSSVMTLESLCISSPQLQEGTSTSNIIASSGSKVADKPALHSFTQPSGNDLNVPSDISELLHGSTLEHTLRPPPGPAYQGARAKPKTDVIKSLVQQLGGSSRSRSSLGRSSKPLMPVGSLQKANKLLEHYKGSMNNTLTESAIGNGQPTRSVLQMPEPARTGQDELRKVLPSQFATYETRTLESAQGTRMKTTVFYSDRPMGLTSAHTLDEPRNRSPKKLSVGIPVSLSQLRTSGMSRSALRIGTSSVRTHSSVSETPLQPKLNTTARAASSNAQIRGRRASESREGTSRTSTIGRGPPGSTSRSRSAAESIPPTSMLGKRPRSAFMNCSVNTSAGEPLSIMARQLILKSPTRYAADPLDMAGTMRDSQPRIITSRGFKLSADGKLRLPTALEQRTVRDVSALNAMPPLDKCP
ncbi:hypothetical protein GMRT_11505 [Giardia muris]|uniref:Uncharacterized protein n=1 Tax=Giardia muris TaxID=5742 RepID=A0A4Z1T2C8_GIAMU|nr:hypothetical protein GMRT_11505 [Giardia muris]|eukprot:TNJ29808.1 hypothetical protein GMRT_11505 [Giardia muris]